MPQPPVERDMSLKPPPTVGKSKGPKKKQNISVSMIKRVEGGGVGLMNPMGWYDAERPSPTHTPGRHDDSALETSDSEDSPTPTPRRSAVPQTPGLGLEDMSAERRDSLRSLPAIVMDSPPRMDSSEME